MIERKSGYKFIRLRAAEGDKQVVIEAPDGDAFVMTVRDVISACQRTQRIDWERQDLKRLLTRLMSKLINWLREHKRAVERAFLTIRDADLLFLVLQKETVKDEELCDDIVGLDIEIAQDEELKFIPLSVLVLPPADENALGGFLNPQFTYQMEF